MSDPIEINDIDDVLFAFQADPPKIFKTRDGQVGSQKTKYADLVLAYEQVMPRLTRMNTLWKATATRDFTIEGAPFVLRYQLLHRTSQTSHGGDWPLKLSDNPQQMGSALTYARRYCLFVALNLVAENEDDDGTAAVMERRPRSTRTEAGTPPPPVREAVQRPPRPAREQARPERPATTPDGDRKLEPRQRSRIMVLLGELGYGGDDQRTTRLELTGRLAGRTIESTNDLTRAEADAVIARLVARQKELEGEKPAARKSTPAAQTAQRSRRESIVGVPDENAQAPWEPADGELTDENGRKLP